MSEEQDEQAEEPLISGAMLRRRPRGRKSALKKPLKKARIVIAFVFLLVLGSGGLYYHYNLSARYAVALNDKPLVALATREQCDQVILLLKNRYAPDVPNAVVFQEGELTTVSLSKSMPTLHVKSAVDKLARRLTPRLEGWGIFVKNVPIVMVASKKDAEETIGLVLQQNTANPDTTPTLVEPVRLAVFHQSIVPGKTPVPVMTPEKAAAELTHPPRRQYATVQRGDSFYAIAMKHRLTVDIIKQWNPNVDPGALQPGDQVRLPDIKAPLTVSMRKGSS